MTACLVFKNPCWRPRAEVGSFTGQSVHHRGPGTQTMAEIVIVSPSAPSSVLRHYHLQQQQKQLLRWGFDTDIGAPLGCPTTSTSDVASLSGDCNSRSMQSLSGYGYGYGGAGTSDQHEMHDVEDGEGIGHSGEFASSFYDSVYMPGILPVSRLLSRGCAAYPERRYDAEALRHY